MSKSVKSDACSRPTAADRARGPFAQEESRHRVLDDGQTAGGCSRWPSAGGGGQSAGGDPETAGRATGRLETGWPRRLEDLDLGGAVRASARALAHKQP